MAGNPYTYSGRGEGFLEDYSGLAGAGSAFESFVNAYQTAEDRKFKKQESMAQLEALKTRLAREAEHAAIDAASKGYRINPITKQAEDAPLGPRERTSNQLKAIAGGARESGFTDDAGNDIYEPNPDYWRIQNVHNQQANKDRTYDLQKDRLGLMQNRFSEVQSQNAIKAGKEIEGDELIKNYQKSRDSLDRGRQLLNGKVPLTYNNLNVVQQDIIDAMTKGSQSSEGKVNREMQHSWIGKWNDLRARAGNYGENNDIRKQDPGLAQQISGLLEEVDSSVAKNMAARYARVRTNYGQSSNPKVKRTIEEKDKAFEPDGKVQQGLVGQTPLEKAASTAPPAQAKDPKIEQFAKANNLDYATAQGILRKRGYGK